MGKKKGKVSPFTIKEGLTSEKNFSLLHRMQTHLANSKMTALLSQ